MLVNNPRHFWRTINPCNYRDVTLADTNVTSVLESHRAQLLSDSFASVFNLGRRDPLNFCSRSPTDRGLSNRLQWTFWARFTIREQVNCSSDSLYGALSQRPLLFQGARDCTRSPETLREPSFTAIWGPLSYHRPWKGLHWGDNTRSLALQLHESRNNHGVPPTNERTNGTAEQDDRGYALHVRGRWT